MQFNKINNKGKARLFNNKYLEYLTKAHPLFIWGMYVPLISFLLYKKSFLAGLPISYLAAAFGAGAFFWTLFEYLIHRFAFHFNPKTNTARKIVYIIHGNHHEYPRDKTRLFMPPVPSLIIAASIFGLMYALGIQLTLEKMVPAFFSGFIMGYLVYGTMHYAIHAWHPPFKWMKPLWRNHHLHHYKDGQKGFGVSTTLWDRLLGTMYPGRKVHSAKIRKL